MDSLSTPSDNPRYHRRRNRLRSPSHFRPTQAIMDRITRAHHQQLRLLHRSDSIFFILGATGNVYSVALTSTPSCTCPDLVTPCKHILFVLIKVLGVSLDETCIRGRSLRPCQLNRLLATPSLPESLAGPGLCDRFNQLFFQARDSISNYKSSGNVSSSSSYGGRDVEVGDGSACPVCLEEMGKGERVVGCGTCRNLIHEECLIKWKQSRGRRAASCVICRAKWRQDRVDQQEEYLNLAPYFSQEDGGGSGSGGGGDQGLCGG